jgi:UDP-N-acetylglucosamine acyltransferase
MACSFPRLTFSSRWAEAMLETPLKTVIHPTAIVDPNAILGAGVQIGAFCVVEDGVRIGAETTLDTGAQVLRHTSLGERNRIGKYAILGGEPMDLKFRGEVTTLEIGDDNDIREFTTIHRATAVGGGVTRVGRHNLIMAYVHITHDCQIGNHTILPNAAQIAGHVIIEDHVRFGATVGVHQFCRIGAHSIVGMMSKVAQDVLPFTVADGHPARHFAINKVGLERDGFSADEREVLASAFKALRAKDTAAMAELEVRSAHAARLFEFARTASPRGISKFV